MADRDAIERSFAVNGWKFGLWHAVSVVFVFCVSCAPTEQSRPLRWRFTDWENDFLRVFTHYLCSSKKSWSFFSLWATVFLAFSVVALKSIDLWFMKLTSYSLILLVATACPSLIVLKSLTPVISRFDKTSTCWSLRVLAASKNFSFWEIDFHTRVCLSWSLITV